MDAYRDPLAAIRGQLAIKRAVVEDAERLLSPLALVLLDDDERASLETAREKTARDGDTVEALLDIERELDALHVLLTDIAARWVLPEEPLLPEAPPIIADHVPVPGMAAVRALLEASFDEGTAEPFGSEAFLMRFFDEGTLFALVTDVFPTERRGVLEVGHLALTLRASMSEALPAFALGPEMDVARYQAKLKAEGRWGRLRARRPPRVLPPERAFWISGHEAAARALIDDEIRHDLLDLLGTCVLEAPSSRVFPKIEAKSGFVEIGYTRSWDGDDTEVLPTEALAILHAIRGRAASSHARPDTFETDL